MNDFIIHKRQKLTCTWSCSTLSMLGSIKCLFACYLDEYFVWWLWVEIYFIRCKLSPATDNEGKSIKKFRNKKQLFLQKESFPITIILPSFFLLLCSFTDLPISFAILKSWLFTQRAFNRHLIITVCHDNERKSYFIQNLKDMNDYCIVKCVCTPILLPAIHPFSITRNTPHH